MSKYLIWDFDGTLGYRTGMWSGAAMEVLQSVVPESNVSREQLRPFLQNGFPWHQPDQPHPEISTRDEWWNRLDPIFERAFMQGAGLDRQHAQILAQQIRDVYPHPANWHLYDDTILTLEALSDRGWKHFMLSNHVPELTNILVYLGIDRYFEQVFNSAEIGYEKPHPQAFQVVLNRTNNYSAIWMIGDNIQADIMGAGNLGIPSILVRKKSPAAKIYCETLIQVLDVV